MNHRRELVADRTTIAARLGVTKARITKLLDLTLLAPDLQEAVLAMKAVDGVEPMSELKLRAVAQVREWHAQRRRPPASEKLSPRSDPRSGGTALSLRGRS